MAMIAAHAIVPPVANMRIIPTIGD